MSLNPITLMKANKVLQTINPKLSIVECGDSLEVYFQSDRIRNISKRHNHYIQTTIDVLQKKIAEGMFNEFIKESIDRQVRYR